MTARGTYNQEGENVYLWKNLDGSYEYVPSERRFTGGVGVGKKNTTVAGNPGEDGEVRSTGRRWIRYFCIIKSRGNYDIRSRFGTAHHTQEAREAGGINRKL